jgi:hypothetical protein
VQRTMYEPPFPCFSVLANDCVNPFTVEVEGKLALAVFTSEVELRKYRARGEAMGPTIRFESPEALALYLDSLPSQVTMIAFYSDDSGRVIDVSAGELYRRVLERLKK